jgi:DNA-binding response OmpR family regulator
MKAKILVADDEEVVRRSLEDILRLEGYQVKSVCDGKAALEALQAEPFDLILLDLKMPEVDGLEVMRFASRVAQDTRVILITGQGSLESAVEALRHGAHDYILKPAHMRDLLNSVANALSKRAEQKQRRILLEQLETSIKHLKDAEGLEFTSHACPKPILFENGVMIDLARREVWRGDQRVSLTPTEGKLLQVLLENRNRVMAHRELVQLVQGYDISDWEAPEVLRPLVSRLRRKLSTFSGSEEWIANVRGTGYVFEGVRN